MWLHFQHRSTFLLNICINIHLFIIHQFTFISFPSSLGVNISQEDVFVDNKQQIRLQKLLSCPFPWTHTSVKSTNRVHLSSRLISALYWSCCTNERSINQTDPLFTFHTSFYVCKQHISKIQKSPNKHDFSVVHHLHWIHQGNNRLLTNH